MITIAFRLACARAGVSSALICFATFAAVAAAPRVLEDKQLPNDSRLGELKDLDGYFPFTPAKSREEWDRRAERVREQILVSLGLWPMPSKTPLNPVIHGRVERDDYTVEKVFFESAPGFFVTGNLYRPKSKTGPHPGVLCPHGHWTNGRFLDRGEEAVRRDIVEGAERFEEGGRSLLQARCVQLARMGCVVFHYDMLGYADSVQIPLEIAHGFQRQRPEMNTTEDWGLFSPQAEAHLQNVMGLQTWNTLRALDFLLSLPEVDAERVACTGESGGGTQTMILGALDPRLKVAFPAVMVSTAMQGGCTCENACLLRIDTGNVEFAALFAPKPLGLTSANDWTVQFAAKGFPELKQHYGMFGVTNNVMLKRGEHFGHNYNHVSRAAMYSWLNKQFKLGFREPVLEQDYQRLSTQEMSVWDEQHPKPTSGPDFERKLLRWFHEDAQQKIRELEKSPAEHRNFVRDALEVLIGRNLSEVGEVEFLVKNAEPRDGYTEKSGLLRNRTHDEELPVIFLRGEQWKGRTILWLDEAGKAGLYEASGAVKPEILKLVKSGAAVVGADLVYQGEFLTNATPLTKTRRVKNPREAAAYTFGYNYTVFAQRVQDILSLVSYAKSDAWKTKTLDVVALDGTGPLAVVARALAGDAITSAAIRTGGFQFGKVLDIHDVNFLPGGAKYGDLAGMFALTAPNRLWLADAGESKETVSAAYRQVGVAGRLAVFAGAENELRDQAVQWLLKSD